MIRDLDAKEFLNFLVVNIHLFTIVLALEELINCLSLSLLNVKFDQVSLDKGDDILEGHAVATCVLLNDLAEWREL